MERKRALRFRLIALIVVVAATVLVGCGSEQSTPDSADAGDGEAYTSEVLDASYEGALDATGQLALGTIQMEETENAVTVEQATTLLPLWQALQGGVTARAEVNAVLKQIEGTMTQEQLAAIAAMQLTREDLGAWMREQGLGMEGGGPGGDPDARATRQAQFGGGEGGEMPPEAATRRAEFANMSEEERQELRATMQAGGGFAGGPGGGGRGGAGGRQYMIFLAPLTELLEARAGEM